MVWGQNSLGLTSLDVAAGRDLIEETVKAVAEHCPGLMSFNVESCDYLTDVALEAEAERRAAASSRVSTKGVLSP